MKEIITLQFGGFANFVGSHFWNFQDELLGLAEDSSGNPVLKNTGLDMDVLYRLGETSQGRLTYTPRLLSINQKGSLGALGVSGSLHDQSSSVNTSVCTWDGNVTKHLSEPCGKNEFLHSLEEEEVMVIDAQGNAREQDKACIKSLENGVQFWTDYSKVQYHPFSLYEMEGVWKDVIPFEDYGSGTKRLMGTSQEEELSNRLHFFIEECDHMQGFQVLVDDSGGFASVAVDFLEMLVEEYGQSPMVLYTIRDPSTFVKTNSMSSTVIRNLHDSISFSKLSLFAGLTVPVGISSLERSEVSKFLTVDDSNLFHSSAVYAASLHTVSWPFRMESLRPSATTEVGIGGTDMSTTISNLLNNSRLKTPAIMDLAIPAPPVKYGQYKTILERSLHPLTPDIGLDTADRQVFESLVILGALQAGKEERASVSELKDALCGFQQGIAGGTSYSNLSISQCPLPIPLPFPSIFGNSVGNSGQILENPLKNIQRQGSLDVFSVPLAARLRCSEAVLPFLKKRIHNLHSFGIARGCTGSQVLESWGFERDDARELEESLIDMVRSFDSEQNESCSDSD